MLNRLLIRYYCWWRWYMCDIRLLNGYTWSWLTKGLMPYCLAAIPPYLFTLLVLTVIYVFNPLFDKPPTYGAGFIGPMHYFMRTGRIRLTTPKSRVWEVLYAERGYKYRRKIAILRHKRRTLYKLSRECEAELSGDMLS